MVATILHCKLKVSIRALCINIDVAKYSACISIATHVGVRRSEEAQGFSVRFWTSVRCMWQIQSLMHIQILDII